MSSLGVFAPLREKNLYPSDMVIVYPLEPSPLMGFVALYPILRKNNKL